MIARLLSPRSFVALFAAILVAGLTVLLFAEVADAQVPAAVATMEAAPPACDAKVLEKCAPNAGDTAWMMTSVALVLMMTIPGLGLFYGGMVRKKNVGDTVMTSFAVACLVTVLWTICTYSLALRPGTAWIGGLDRLFMQGVLSDVA